MPLHNAIIRTMHQGDIVNLVKTFCFPWSSLQETTEKWTRNYAEHQMGTRTVYLVEIESQIIGYASLLSISECPHFKHDHIPEIHDLWISQEWRNKGFGKKLILHLEDSARMKGYKHIGLGVGLYKDYGQAQRLYCTLGYIPDGNGITYKGVSVTPCKEYPVDDDLILWLTKLL